MSAPGRIGVLVMAHGTPERPEDLEAFYTRIRGGRPPSAEQLAELAHRYEAIGGLSPLTERTEAQVAGIRRTLEEQAPGTFTVRFGAKHAEPLIETAAAELVDEGVSGVIGLVLTPQESAMGSGQYLERARVALSGGPSAGVPFLPVSRWYDHPVLVGLLADRLSAVLGDGADPADLAVVFTAHSLPERILAEGDPYPEQVTATASAVAEATGLFDRGIAWQLAWQSAGRTPDPWMGPDLLSVIRELGRGRSRRVVVCPVGFVSDHLEILFDVDVEAAGVAREVGLDLTRTPSLNDDPRFVALLADLVRGAATEFETPERAAR